MTRRSAIALLSMLLPLGLEGTNHSREIVIIAHPSDRISEITAEDLKAVYLGVKSSLKDAGQVRPVLTKSAPTYEAFLREYLGKSDSALQTFYRSQVFSGQGGFPKTVNSNVEAIEYVGRTRGAIGYVDASAVTGSVKTIPVR